MATTASLEVATVQPQPIPADLSSSRPSKIAASAASTAALWLGLVASTALAVTALVLTRMPVADPPAAPHPFDPSAARGSPRDIIIDTDANQDDMMAITFALRSPALRVPLATTHSRRTTHTVHLYLSHGAHC